MANYILKGKEFIAEPDIIKWAKWFETADRTVAKTDIGDIRISTVFLGVDHNFSCGPEPVLFETCQFGGVNDGLIILYLTWNDAEEGHEIIVEELQNEPSH